ncbi:glycoside hydrolase [Mycolicibacterium holsaticum]|uniref:Glycoside hydrolase n=1 Tax=Mycolicibacterium holsaticum TaxID=152142 RepID=A0A1E3RXM3_9MYCO|nr:glycoside hydrolase [Mycolicibacterium holsaticum]MDA4105837.1 glycoside hydrolase [Mycolicibacterium holsaticum DSM 44478 = JCM 12374]ODQ94675.1 glycoside hydrolase [Mycolicibacterium holsaticum]
MLFVREDRLASGRGRWLALVASIALAAGLFYAQTAEPAPKPPAAPVPAGQVAKPADAPPIRTPTEAELMAASAPVATAAVPFQLPPGVAPENGLQVNTIRVARALSVLFPEITTIGGYRQDPLKWHPNGLAIDVMIPNHGSEKGIELGNQIAGFALANAQRWGVIHVIWRQGFYPGVGAPSWTADYGNETANHFDHVHIATNGGGYPTGDENYVI